MILLIDSRIIDILSGGTAMYHYNAKYVKELEDLVQDILLPSHIMWCRSVGRDPETNDILKRMINAKALQDNIPFLLKATK